MSDSKNGSSGWIIITTKVKFCFLIFGFFNYSRSARKCTRSHYICSKPFGANGRWLFLYLLQKCRKVLLMITSSFISLITATTVQSNVIFHYWSYRRNGEQNRWFGEIYFRSDAAGSVVDSCLICLLLLINYMCIHIWMAWFS